jgi:hypothetical protein
MKINDFKVGDRVELKASGLYGHPGEITAIYKRMIMVKLEGSEASVPFLPHFLMIIPRPEASNGRQ